MDCVDVSSAKIRKIEAPSGKTKEAGKYVFGDFPLLRLGKFTTEILRKKMLKLDQHFFRVGKHCRPGI